MKYVTSVNPTLATLIRETCVEASLTSTRGRPGVTFLMPDAALTKKIQDLAWSKNPEEAEKACDLLSALILPNVYKTAADFKSGVVINSLYPPQEVVVEKIDAAKMTVHFAGGATAKLDTKFVQMRGNDSKKKELTIWNLSGGLIPIDGKPADMSAGKKKHGQYQPSEDQFASTRFQLMLQVEQAYMFSKLHGSFALKTTTSINKPYQACVHSMLKYLEQQHPGLYDKVIPMLACDNFDFYIMFEPHATPGSDYLIPNDVLQQWYSTSGDIFSDNNIPKENKIESQTASDAAVFTKREQLLRAICKMRRQATDKTLNNARTCIDYIEKIYETLERDNSIDDVSNVFPSSLHEYYKSNPMTKMIHDDLRYITFIRFSRLDRKFDAREFNELVNFIGDSLHSLAVDQRKTSRGVLNTIRIKNMIAPTAERDEVVCFVNSTAFLSIPLRKEELSSLGRYSITKPNPGKVVLFNIHANIYEALDRLHNERVNAQINSIRGMTDEERKRLADELAKYA